MYRPLATLFCLVLLTACSSQGPRPDESAVPAADDTNVAETATPEEAEPIPERAFPNDSLFELLVAEFALRRNAPNLSLHHYLQQAELLRDVGVSAHATHLAQYLKREPEALRAVKLWVELEPDNTEANNTLAKLLVRSGNASAAMPHLAQVARSAGQANFPILLSGFSTLDSSGKVELQRGIEALTAEFPDNTQLLLTQALLLTELEQLEQAQVKLDQLFAIEPAQQQAILLEAKILQSRGVSQPFMRLEEALKSDPQNKRLRLQYARLLAASDMSSAREQFELLSVQSPRDGDLLLSLALINREMGDDLEAKAYLRQILALEQRVDEAHYYLGRIAEDKGDLSEAIAHYILVEEGREFLSAASRMGNLLIAAGRIDDARLRFNQLRASHPKQQESLFGLEANLLAQAGAGEAAMDTLNLGLEAVPASNALRYSRSMLAEQLNNLELMESDLRAIIALDPDNATALNALGYTLSNRSQRYDEAHELISRALSLQPDEPAILDSMGWVLYRLGELQESIKFLRRAFDAFPDPEVAAHLGEVLWVQGDRAGAAAVWRQALSKDPRHEVLVGTLKRLGVQSLDGIALDRPGEL